MLESNPSKSRISVGRLAVLCGAARRDTASRRVRRKGTNGVSTNWVTAIFMFFDRGTFRALPLLYFYLPKSARAYLFPQSVKVSHFCSGPISVDPHLSATKSGSPPRHAVRTAGRLQRLPGARAVSAPRPAGAARARLSPSRTRPRPTSRLVGRLVSDASMHLRDNTITLIKLP